jgi:hypothetical protein
MHPRDTVATEGQLRLTPNARVLLLNAAPAQPTHSSDNVSTTP